jgi:hypothetical protein
MSFDLGKNNLSAAADAGYEFELIYPATEEKTGAFVKVRGEASKIVKAFGRKKYAENEAKRIQDARKGKDTSAIDLDELEDLAIESAIVRIISWRGITDGGEEVVFTPDNARKILKEHDWIRKQVLEESSQILNFRPTSD